VNNHNDAICSAGATDCCFDGHTPSACTNLQTDVNNCGICGHVCANTESCDRGVCTLSAAPLPFWLHYCADPNCGGLQPLVVHVCPEDNPPCTPSRQTTVVPRLDGHQIDQVLFPMQASDGGAGVIATLEAGAARS